MERFAGIITGDESWFFRVLQKSWMDIRERNAPEWISQKNDTEKHMLTIFSSTTGPLVEDWLPTNGSFNRTYFCQIIVPRRASAAFPDLARQRK
jgi:hypothetical protein